MFLLMSVLLKPLILSYQYLLFNTDHGAPDTRPREIRAQFVITNFFLCFIDCTWTGHLHLQGEWTLDRGNLIYTH